MSDIGVFLVGVVVVVGAARLSLLLFPLKPKRAGRTGEKV